MVRLPPQRDFNAIAVISIAPRGCLYNTKNFYMEKLAVGPKAKGAIDLEKPLKENLLNIAKALDKNIEDLTVTILERDRHKDIMAQCRQLGCRIKLFTDGDVGAAIATCFEDSGVDVLAGIGGCPEGVLAAPRSSVSGVKSRKTGGSYVGGNQKSADRSVLL